VNTVFKLANKITPFLWYDNQASEAAALYIRLVGNGRVVHTQHWGEGTPYAAGSVMAVSFELHGQPLIAFNGGPHFKLNEAASLFVQCDDQAEVDRLWDGLIADGGAASQCGWLKDRFGLSWQIVPKAHLQMMSSGDSVRVTRLVQAMMTMAKLDIAALERAFDGR
jgi:predicted 3-demethylubiquinone-9 3-methyltransferase (glyoxalase superfamily)